MITLGLTGSIGMGKSTLVTLLRDRGIPVHDSDQFVHNAMAAGGPAVATISRHFPCTLKTDANGQAFIDRTLLSSALQDDAALKTLEGILHPLVLADAEQFKQQMQRDGHALVALEIPLLFEVGAEHLVDVTICVSAPAELQRARVLARPNMSEEKFATILARQMPDAEKRRRADYIIENDGDLEHLKMQLDQILARLAERAQHA